MANVAAGMPQALLSSWVCGDSRISSQYSGFRPSELTRWLDFLEVHFYPLDGGVYTYGGPNAERRNLAYLTSVVEEVARPGKPVVLAEFGWYGGGKPALGSWDWPAATEADQARWCRLAVEATRGTAVGWLNWGLYDAPEAGDVSQLTGLLKVDGRVKSWGHTFSELASSLRDRPPLRRGPSTPALDWDACTTDPHARTRARERLIQSTTHR